MTFELAGIQWTPKDTLTHASNMLATINAGRQSRGESTLAPTTANALWLFLLAAGAKNADMDGALSIAFNSVNPATCDDQQILNMAPMVGTSLTPATYSTGSVVVTVSSTSVPLNIPVGTLIPFGDLTFQTTEAVSYATPPATVTIPVRCSAAGAVSVPAHTLTSFKGGVANVASVDNPTAGVIGTAAETVASLRRRIIVGDTRSWGVDAAIRALRALTGVTAANVFFNPSATDPLILPGPITILPRNAYIVIQGSSADIATAYVNTMSAPTAGSQTSIYTTLSGQALEVKYDLASNLNAYVRVYYESSSPTTAGFDTAIKSIVTGGQDGLYPGTEITAQYFSELLSGFTLAKITGVSVSTDNVTWSRTAPVNGDQYPVLDATRVTVIGE